VPGLPACHYFALVKTGQSGVDHVHRRHHGPSGQFRVLEAALFPDIRRCRRKQHRLDADAFVSELVVQRMAQPKDKGLAGAVHAIEPPRRDADHRCDVDDRSRATRDEGGGHGISQPRERGDVKRDHRLHLVNVRVQKRRAGGHAGIVDEHGYARVATKHGLDFRQRRLVAEVGGDHFDGPTCL